MRYLRIYAGGDGASRFEDVELEGTLTRVVDGVPPSLYPALSRAAELRSLSSRRRPLTGRRTLPLGSNG